MSRTSRTTTLLAVAALGVSVLTAPATAHDAPRQAAPAVPVISWGDCEDIDDPVADDAQCATVRVPLDHDRPNGATVPLDLLRKPATDPDQRIGTLFVNPGGPGGSSRFFALFFGELVPAEVSQRFDVVGIDPRGVGPSAPARCRKPGEGPPVPSAPFPVDPHQVHERIAYDRWQRQACRDGGRPVIDHMSTADTARDMDLIRQAVGDPRLTYYGVSYGSQLGTTYAAMFPDNVRAMVLDGVVNPVQWSTGGRHTEERPYSERVGSGVGAWQGMTNALAECDRVGPERCAIAGRAPEVWSDIIDRLRRGPFQGITYADVVIGSLGALFDARIIPFLMQDLDRLHDAMFGGGSLRRESVLLRHTTTSRDRGVIPGPYGLPRAMTPTAAGYGLVQNPFAAVACADSDNPSDPRAWVEAARRADRRSPWFGAAWTWASSTCAGWPASTQADRFTGPYDATTSSPVLLIGNTYDPATPLQGARAVNRMLDGSRLVVYDGWGHGAIGTGPCIGRASAAYLVRGTLPAPGTVCSPSQPLFPEPG